MALKALRGTVEAPAALPAALPLPGPSGPMVVVTLEVVLGQLELPRAGKMSKLTPNEVKRLADLTYKNGIPVLTLQRPILTYEIIGMCGIFGVNPLFDFLDGILRDDQYAGMDLVFEGPAFAKERNQYLADVDRQRRAITVQQGVKECPKCHSMNTMTVEVQLRSADEPMTSLTACFGCGTRSKE